MKRIFTAIGATAAIAAAFALAACDEPTKQDAPEPTSDNIVDGTGTQVIRMPDGFRNVAVTCYKGNLVFVTSRGAFQSGSADFTTLPSGIAVVAGGCK